MFRLAGARLQEQLEAEALSIARVAASDDSREGISALLEKRRPAFRGC